MFEEWETFFRNFANALTLPMDSHSPIVYTSTTNRGISHCDEVDFRRRKLSKKTPLNNYEISDMANFYLDMVNDLVTNYGF